MTEYTPTTAEMRSFYTAERLDGPHLEGLPEPTVGQAEAEFDRWFATVSAPDVTFPPSYRKDRAQAIHELWIAATSSDYYVPPEVFGEMIAAVAKQDGETDAPRRPRMEGGSHE